MILALAGGVGGARLARGLADALPAGRLTVAVNTGDDFDHLGLRICPDIDTVTYTLADLHNRDLGWGLAGETWEFMGALARLGGEDWFRLGDRDLATHVERTRRLALGESLSTVTADVARRLGIVQRVVPMSDDPVRTFVDTDVGMLAFQDYFVRRRAAPAVRGFEYRGADSARPSPAFAQTLADPALEAIVFCPSNPWLSIAPLLAIPRMAAQLRATRRPLVAVSPIIGGRAVKGPAAKIMNELGLASDVVAIARHYAGLLDGLVIDSADADRRAAIEALGLRVLVADTLMDEGPRRTALARATLEFARTIGQRPS